MSGHQRYSFVNSSRAMLMCRLVEFSTWAKYNSNSFNAGRLGNKLWLTTVVEQTYLRVCSTGDLKSLYNWASWKKCYQCKDPYSPDHFTSSSLQLFTEVKSKRTLNQQLEKVERELIQPEGGKIRKRQLSWQRHEVSCLMLPCDNKYLWKMTICQSTWLGEKWK